MEGTQIQMAQYTKVLLEHTKQQGVPVTEVIPFKLKEPINQATAQYFETQIFASANKGKGLTRAAWGLSLNDPNTLIWMMDWDTIEDHWEFWQTENFLPVMEGINRLFIEGRPLVRHYKFEPKGLLHNEFVRVVIWNEKKETTVGEALNGKVLGQRYLERKGGFAIDMHEETWFCTLLGYDSLEEANADDVNVEAIENHVVVLKHVVNS